MKGGALSTKPLPSVADTLPPPRGGGWVRGQNRFVYLKIGLKFPAPFINFIFHPRNNVFDVGEWVGRPGLARAPNTPPPRGGHQAMACFLPPNFHR